MLIGRGSLHSYVPSSFTIIARNLSWTSALDACERRTLPNFRAETLSMPSNATYSGMRAALATAACAATIAAAFHWRHPLKRIRQVAGKVPPGQ